jgi:hypothetical protein
MKEFLINMLSDASNESVSTKRVIGFLGFLVLSGLMIASSYASKPITPNADLLESVKYITIAAIFGNTLEKFAPILNTLKNAKPVEPTEEPKSN